MLRRMILIVLAVSLFPVYGFSADVPGQDDWCPPSAGPITTWTAPVCAKGDFVMQPFLFFVKTRGTYDNSGNYSSLPDDDKSTSNQFAIFMQYGLTDRLELDGQVLYQKNFIRQAGMEADSAGLGDSCLFARYCLKEETPTFPHMTLVAQLKLPTGKFENLNPEVLGTDAMGSGSYDPGLGIILTKRAKPFIIHADAIVSQPLKVDVDNVSTKYGTYLNGDAGMECFIYKGINLLFEVNGFYQGKTDLDGTKIDDSNSEYLMLTPGIGWSNDQVQTLLAYQQIVSGKNTDATAALVLTLVYSF
jgi:hypothetical protein